MESICLANLSSKTTQEVFDFVLLKLREQGRPSVRESGNGCLYRGPHGLKCAAGHLISDEEWEAIVAEASNDPWPSDPNCRGWMALIGEMTMVDTHASFISQLQRIHDANATDEQGRPVLHDQWMRDFEQGAQHLAEKHKLIYTPPSA